MTNKLGRQSMIKPHRICRECGYKNGYTIVGREIEYCAAGPCEWCKRNTVTANSSEFGWPEPPAKFSGRVGYDR